MDVIEMEVADVQGIGDIATLLQTTTVAAGSPQVTAASSTAFVQNGGTGAATLSLRGLGANRTLVLLNGRRAGPAGVRGGVSSFDLNVLPLNAIERVEILKDGASSIYGSDAVAGVVNIITDKSDGGSFDAFISQPGEDGGETSRVSFKFGDTVGRLHYSMTGDYYRAEELAKGDRDYFNCGEEYVFDPATGDRADTIDPRTGKAHCTDLLWGHVWIYDYDGEIPSRSKAQYDYDGDLGNYIDSFEEFSTMNTPAGWYPVAYDRDSMGVTNADHPFQDEASLIPKTELTTLYGEAKFDINDDTTAYAELLLNRRENYVNGYRQFWSYTYNESSDYFTGNSAPTADGWTGNQWLSSTPITDQNDNKITVDYSRVVAGLMGNFSGDWSDWSYDLSIQKSRSEGEYMSQQVLDDAMRGNNWLGGLCEGTKIASGADCIDLPWFDPQFLAGNFTPEQMEYLFAWETGVTEYDQVSIEGFVTGPLMELPAGTMGFAMGFQTKKDEIIDTPGQLTRDGLAALTSTAGITAGSDRTKAVFAEVDVPLLEDMPFVRSLALNASMRYTEVASYGSGDTYKVGINWDITDTVKLRASNGTSFRTPSLYELYLANQTASARQSAIDPCIDWEAAIEDGDISQRVADNCAADGVDGDHYAAISATTISGGNGDTLEAETSKTNTIGLVWRPEFADLNISVDYFDITVNDEISQLGAGSIVFGCYNSVNFPNDPLCDLFERDPVDMKVDNVYDQYINIAEQTNRGWDLSARYTTEVPWGELVFDTQHTFQIEDSILVRDGSPNRDYNGRMGDPKWTGRASLELRNNDWSYYWGMNFIGDASDVDDYGTDEGFRFGTPVRFVLGADRIVYHNLSVSKAFPDSGVLARFGVNNALDTKPPRLTTLNLGQVSTEGNSAFYSQYNWRGRSFFFNVTKDF
jgi:outer membrane receptor protein involved in Fe transport